jgi:hypothetical protein
LVLGDDNAASLFGLVGEIEGLKIVVFDLVSAIVLLSAQFTVHFWYGK